MATDNNRTKTPNDAVKITELPEGSQLLLVDKSGTVLERMEAERFMELLRATVQVGGRNLLKDSQLNLTTVSIVNREMTAYLADFPSGTPITLSFDYEHEGVTFDERSRFGIQIGVKNMGGYQLYAECLHYLTSASDKGRATRTIILPDGMDIRTTKMQCFIQNISGGTVKLSNVKVERGNVVSDWTPAPEDLGFGGVIYWLIDCCKSAPSPLRQQTQTTTNQTKER